MSRNERFALFAAVLIGAFVRVTPVVSAGSVVGDGGLILAMIDDLRAAGLVLPAVTSYNRLDIPFVYPPAALLLTAALGLVTGIETLDLLRWLPVTVSIGCLVAFAWLAHRTLPPVTAVGATFAFALMPSAYGWLVAGGGLTRGIGLLFAILAAGLVARREPQPSIKTAAAAGALLGLSALTHPQTAVFGVVACIVLSWRAPARQWLARMGVAAAVAVIVLVPWLVWVSTTHGLDSLVAAGNRLEPAVGLIRMFNLRFSAAPFMDVVGVVGAIGLAASVWRREFRLPVLLAATYLTGPGGGEFLAAVPWALLSGVGVAMLVEAAAGALSRAPRMEARAVAVALGSVALFLALIGSLGSVVDRSSKLHPMPPDLIAAMAWLADNTAEDMVVLVPTSEVWGYDEVSEWLPAFAHRYSLGTVQGSEWLGSDGFDAQLSNHERILDCAGQTATCYADIDSEAVVFIPKGKLAGLLSSGDCCPALRETVAANGYRIIYDGPGATIALAED